MSTERLEYLFNCFLNNNYSEQEEEEMMTLLAQPGNQETVQKLIDGVIKNTGSEIRMTDQVAASILQNILQKDKGKVLLIKNKKPVFATWTRVAAAVILFLAGASYWIFDKKGDPKVKVGKVTEIQSRILPGKNQALLTTGDGSTIILDSQQNGTLIQQGNTKLNKQGGVLIYNVSDSSRPGSSVVFNTLSTPRGGQYAVVLSDGSKVWLNAASSLHFPTTFAGSQRGVELTGEAYFEVAKNKEKPFQVKVGEMKVNVLGTHFNINAYSDESSIKTSLLEGSVKITRGNASGILKPGEQAVLNNKEDKVEITNANLDEAMAWKNGLFQFEGADINNIMREIGRWYNVEIVYTGKIPMRRFVGKISRNAQLADVLQILELSNVKFTVVGNKIIVQ